VHEEVNDFNFEVFLQGCSENSYQSDERGRRTLFCESVTGGTRIGRLSSNVNLLRGVIAVIQVLRLISPCRLLDDCAAVCACLKNPPLES
jgi:hypothetical protein